MKFKIILDGILTWHQYLPGFRKSWILEKERYCPICNEEIYWSEEIVLFINNQLLFPNISCHLRCAQTVDVDLIKQIKASYDVVKEAIENNKAWRGCY
jgi:hypothetical protein